MRSAEGGGGHGGLESEADLMQRLPGGLNICTHSPALLPSPLPLRTRVQHLGIITRPGCKMRTGGKGTGGAARSDRLPSPPVPVSPLCSSRKFLEKRTGTW